MKRQRLGDPQSTIGQHVAEEVEGVGVERIAADDGAEDAFGVGHPIRRLVGRRQPERDGVVDRRRLRPARVTALMASS